MILILDIAYGGEGFDYKNENIDPVSKAINCFIYYNTDEKVISIQTTNFHFQQFGRGFQNDSSTSHTLSKYKAHQLHTLTPSSILTSVLSSLHSEHLHYIHD